MLLFGIIALLVGNAVGETTTETPPPLPETDVNLVRFLYYTSSSNFKEIKYNDANSLAASGINLNNPTIFLVDGFLSNFTNSLMTQDLKTALLAKYSSSRNIIVLDWGALSGGQSGLSYNSLTSTATLLLFPVVQLNIPKVGERIADFIQFLSVQGSQVTLIGHSFGAHVVGNAGTYSKNKWSRTLRQITGLDPGGPLLNLELNPEHRIFKGEASWVEIYHTGRFGFGDLRTDQADFEVYINGGSGQPGCDIDLTKPLGLSYCDHTYSWRFYLATVNSNAEKACPCNNSLINLTPCTCILPIICGSLGSCGVGLQKPVGFNSIYGRVGQFYLEDSNVYPA